MSAITILVAATGLVLGLRLNAFILGLLLLLGVTSIFTIGIWSGGNLGVVALHVLAMLASVQISYLIGFLIAARARKITRHRDRGVNRQSPASCGAITKERSGSPPSMSRARMPIIRDFTMPGSELGRQTTRRDDSLPRKDARPLLDVRRDQLGRSDKRQRRLVLGFGLRLSLEREGHEWPTVSANDVEALKEHAPFRVHCRSTFIVVSTLVRL